jgi:hypothetical protein
MTVAYGIAYVITGAAITGAVATVVYAGAQAERAEMAHSATDIEILRNTVMI